MRRQDRVAVVCPETRQRLTPVPLAEAVARIGGAGLVPRVSTGSPAFGPTPTVLLRDDDRCAYPVVDGMPVLLIPEQLVAEQAAASVAPVDLADPRYAEAYDEMAHYNEVARQQADRIEVAQGAAGLARVVALGPLGRQAFPRPRRAWVDATYESVAQAEAFDHLAPMTGATVLQLGGKGIHAVRFLLAGAAEAWVLSPMVEELAHGQALARHLGVEEGYRAAAGVAEEMPFPDETFDAIYSDSCVHHMVTELAAGECHRILRPGGRFAATEPWRAPFYDWGIKVFGKREKEVSCRPMTAERAAPFLSAFEEASVLHHGLLTRYPLLALAQLGVELRPSVVYGATRMDDACCSIVPRIRQMGSSTAILARRSGRPGR